ncbi:MAG: FimV/HubP family polar landmark protein, partial [Pseudomonadota bacterium]|nr:FimV/HubP family polar landmark protein [Pseudomonadota bacterium]
MLRLIALIIFFIPNLLYANIYYSTNVFDNLWSIAIEVKKDNPEFSLYQIMIAMQDLNPDSFKEENINFLKKDKLLRTPDLYLLSIYDKQQSVRDVAEQNSFAGNQYTDYALLENVLVLTEPETSLEEIIENDDYFLVEKETSEALPEISITVEENFTEAYVDSGIAEESMEETSVIPEIAEESVEETSSFSEMAEELVEDNYINIVSNSSEALQENFQDIEPVSSIDYQLTLIIGLFIFLVFLGILYFRSSPSDIKEVTHNKENLEEEYEEIGDPYEARLNLATMYIEMKDFDQAKQLIDEIIENAEDEGV